MESLTKNLAVCLTLIVSLNGWAGLSHWNFSIPTTSSGSFTADETASSTSLAGTFDRLANGFMKLVVTGGSGSALPPMNTTKFGFEIPALTFMAQPFLFHEGRMSFATSTGSCPTSTWSGILSYYYWRGANGTTYDVSQSYMPAVGLFSWNPATSQSTLSDIRNLTSYSTITGFSSLTMSGTCSNGEISFSGSGDRGGTLYLSSDNGGVYAAQTERAFYIVPQTAIPAAANLNGTYAAFFFDTGWPQRIHPVRFTITGGTDGSGDELTDIESGTTDSTRTWAMSSISINAPFNGAFTTSLSLEGGTARNMICTAYLTNRTLILCAGQHPDNAADPINLVMFSDSQASPSGSLDTYSFGGGTGKATTNIGGTDTAYDIALQADGKILLAGGRGTTQHALVRYEANGSLDTTFSGDGINFSSAGVSFFVAPQPDGKIYTGGSGASAGAYALRRWNSDGSVDSSFGTAGVVYRTLAGFTARDMAPTLDNKFVGYGRTTSSWGLMRLLSDGALDTTFSSDGLQTASIGTNTQGGVSVQNDNKPVMFGGRTSGNSNFYLVRFLEDGTIDSSFGTSGRATVTVTTAADTANAVSFDASGRILVAGYATISSQKFAIARLSSAGALDTTFGSSGITTVSFSTGNDLALGVTLQTDGKIIVVGSANAAAESAVVRLNADGALDTSFDTDGKITVSLGASTERFVAAAVQTNDRIVLGGNTNTDFAVARIWP